MDIGITEIVKRMEVHIGFAQRIVELVAAEELRLAV